LTHSIFLRISPVAPSFPPVLTQHQYWLPQARWQPLVSRAEKKIIICTHTAIRHNLSHRYFLLITVQKIKRC